MAPHRIPCKTGIFISDDNRTEYLSSSSAFKSPAEEHFVKNSNNNWVHAIVHKDNAITFYPTIDRNSGNTASDFF